MTRFGCLLAVAALLAVLFVANRQYVYSDRLDRAPRLTASHIADPRFAGATFQVEGRVTSIRTMQQGIVVIDLHQAEEGLFVGVPVFPALGCLPVKPVRDERVRVTGNLGMYRGRPQIRPLSAAHVELVAPPIIAWTATAAAERTGETLYIGPLRTVASEFFESRQGWEHLRLTLADVGVGMDPVAESRAMFQGIMYQNAQTACEVDLLRSGEPFMVTAEVVTYRGAPSLNVRRVLRFGAADHGVPDAK